MRDWENDVYSVCVCVCVHLNLEGKHTVTVLMCIDRSFVLSFWDMRLSLRSDASRRSSDPFMSDILLSSEPLSLPLSLGLMMKDRLFCFDSAFTWKRITL